MRRERKIIVRGSSVIFVWERGYGGQVRSKETEWQLSNLTHVCWGSFFCIQALLFTFPSHILKSGSVSSYPLALNLRQVRS